MTRPLDGIKILDLSRYLPGPFATQMLADAGAEVIKIEEPGGELGRMLPPLINGLSPRFCSVNRNKRCITLDLKKPGGRAIFLKLAETADVVVDQFRPGVMDKLGLGYESLNRINSGIIYCSITGYGLTGPWRDRAGHDLNYMNTAGASGLIAGRNGEPVLPGIQVADLAGGSLYPVIAILMALFARTRTGRGQLCDIAMMDGVLSLLAYTIGEWSGNGSLPRPGKELFTGGFAMYSVYRCADARYVSLGAIEQKFWHGFCDKLGLEEFKSLQYIPERQEEMIEAIGKIMLTRSRDQWVEFFSDKDICFTPVLELPEVPENEQVKARETMIKIADFMGGGTDIFITGNPVKLSDTPCEVVPGFSAAGAETYSVLSAAGYSDDDIERFRLEGAV